MNQERGQSALKSDGGGWKAARVTLVAFWAILLLVAGASLAFGVWLDQSRPLPPQPAPQFAMPAPPEPRGPDPEDLAVAEEAQVAAQALLAGAPQNGEGDETLPAIGTAPVPEEVENAAAPPPPPSIPGRREQADAPVVPAAAPAEPEIPAERESAGQVSEERHQPQLSLLPSAASLPAWRRYARPSEGGEGDHPRIAIVLTGLGHSASASEAAIERLPPEISLSFSPYARRSAEWMGIARLAGREVLLDLPMEPTTYPTDDPGPRALMVQASQEENLARVDWVLDRASGIIGVTGMLGSHFVTESSAIGPVLDHLAAQGLLYLDNGDQPGNAALAHAATIDMAHAAATLTLDGGQVSRAAIDARLVEIERIARDRGFAVALANPYPVTIDALQAWAAELNERGFTLVPVSALASGDRDTPPLGAAMRSQQEG